ncbi:MAG: hypothetical protein GTO20_15980 [Candidatus Aminicenantes bacterium]|nr:hypothetical protein [Candidatus Aminicenantes bacterium]
MGTIHDITWTGTGTVGNIKIEYSINSGDSWAVIKDSTENDGSFTWAVPDTVSDHCLVRISENDEDGTPVDTSDAEFSIISSTSASLTLTYPNGGEQLPVGSVQVITWKSTGEMGEISLEYSADNGVNWTVIVESTANSGTYDWTIPDAISNTCLVRISEVSGTLSDTSDGVFSIIQQPWIIVISPNGGEIWEAGSVYPVTWQSSGDVGNVTIEYSINSGDFWTMVEDSTENDGSYDWTVPDTPSENCLVRIKGSTDAIIPDTGDAVFSIVSPVSPLLTIHFPNGGETLIIGNTYEITWSSYGAVGEVKIEYSVDSGTNWNEITAAAENGGSFDWTVPDTASDTCLVQVSEIDGDPVDTSDGVFTIAAPSSDYIIVTSPNGGEVLSAGTSFDITWDSSGDIQTVTIEYSIDEGVSWAVVVTSTAKDMVPGNLFNVMSCPDRKWRRAAKTSGPSVLRRRRLFVRRTPSHSRIIPIPHHSLSVCSLGDATRTGRPVCVRTRTGRQSIVSEANYVLIFFFSPLRVSSRAFAAKKNNK